MKNLRQLFAAAVLSAVFATAAFADDGIIHGDRIPPVPPPPASAPADPATTTGEPTVAGDPSAEQTALEASIEIALGFAAQAFSLF
jgi:hypothetical protein